MDNKIVVRQLSANLISIISYFIFLFISLLIQYKSHSYLVLEINPFIILSPLILSVLHELLHYIGYRYLAKIPKNEIFLSKAKILTLPFVTTSTQMSKEEYIKVLVLPTIILAFTLMFFIITSPNLLNSIVFTTGVSIGTGDILMVKSLVANKEASYIKPTENQFGVYVI